MLTSTQSLMDFRKHELLARASTTRGCMVVFPQGKKSRQRVGVGDSSGSVVVFSVGKHLDVQIQYETPPGPKAINRMTLYDDQLFTVAGSKIAAYSKKGKLFFGFESNMTETVRSLQIDTPFIFAGGEYVLTTFQEAAEAGYFMAPDRINEMLIHKHRDAQTDQALLDNYIVFLGCNDRVLRGVRSNQVISEIGCEAPITSLAYAVDDRGKDLVYGTAAGSFGAFSVSKTDDLVRKYSVIPEARLGNITSLASTDINLDGTADIVLGREDGTVEVHACSLHADNAAPLRMWTSNVSEYVTTVSTGLITQVERDEVLVNTFSGKVIAFSLSDVDIDVHKVLPAVLSAKALDAPATQDMIVQIKKAEEKRQKAADAAAKPPEPSPAVEARKADGAQKSTVAEGTKKPDTAATVDAPPARKAPAENTPSNIEIVHAQVTELKAEIEKLRATVEARRTEFASIAGVQEVSKVRAVTSEFRVRDSLALDGAAGLVLTIEADVPIESVGLHSDVDLEILDSESIFMPGSNWMSNASAVKRTKVLGLFKPVEDHSHRVVASFRTVEGRSGTVRAFVVAKGNPRTAQERQYPIRPLSLHTRISESEVDWNALPLSTMTIHGAFSIRDMHGWLLNAFPDVPEVLPASAAANALFFRSTFQGTVLSARYAKSEAEFHSDSLSALTILKDSLIRDATSRKIQVRVQYQAKRESIQRHLELLHPMVSYQATLVAKVKLVEALRELETQEQDASFLSAEYRSILENADRLEKEVKLQPKRMDYLKSILQQLYKDKADLLGENYGAGKLQQLNAILDQYHEPTVEQFFGVGAALLQQQQQSQVAALPVGSASSDWNTDAAQPPASTGAS